jgi:diaminopimelate epimerase
MEIQFNKYQGTGNDFVIIDDRSNSIELTREQIAQICDRRFGIGADGLMLLRTKPDYDFEMVYYNSDGNESTMCGNGGRCIVAFAKKHGVIEDSAKFWAIDGEHFADVNDGNVALGMIDVNEVNSVDSDFELFTGSPHYVVFKNKNVSNNSDFVSESKAIRNNNNYKKEGINVNHVTKLDGNAITMRTYERGVEDETFSCGTGAVAAAIATHKNFNSTSSDYSLEITTPGGMLNVSFNHKNGKYSKIVLSGAATFVFQGTIEV